MKIFCEVHERKYGSTDGRKKENLKGKKSSKKERSLTDFNSD
jgi:hypothetical protein